MQKARNGRRVGLRSFTRRSLALVVAVGLALGGVTFGVSTAHAADELVFEDSQLQAAINYWLDRKTAHDAPVTITAVKNKLDRETDRVMRLRDNFDITSFAGLEALKEVDLRGVKATGSFSSIDPLTELPDVTVLSLTSDHFGPELPQTAKPLTSLTLKSAKITAVEEVKSLGLGVLSELDLRGTNLASLAGVETLDVAPTAELFFGNTPAGRSPIEDLTPLQGLSLQEPAEVSVRVEYASVADLASIANTPLKLLKLPNNHITDISMLSDSIERFEIRNQHIDAGVAVVGETVTNPLKDLDGHMIGVTPQSSGVEVDADGNFSVSTPGTKTLTFEWNDSAGQDKTFSGTIRVEVSAKSITGDVTIPDVTSVGQTLTAQFEGVEPADAALTYQWLVDGETIAGATDVSYTPAASDVGTQISVEVTATKFGHMSHTMRSNEALVEAPVIRVQPDTAAPGGEVSITGNYYAPGEEVVLTLPHGAMVTVVTDHHGSFSTTVRLIENTQPGAYVIPGIGAVSGLEAADDLTVIAVASPPGEPDANELGDDRAGLVNSAGTRHDDQLSATGNQIAAGFLITVATLLGGGAGLLTARGVRRGRKM